MVSDLLWEDYEICTRAGAHCAPLMHETLGTAKQGTVRFSFSWFNTEQEVDAAVTALREIAGDENGYREMV
jgi:selenocysteine lyase/cysteine desulfurase